MGDGEGVCYLKNFGLYSLSDFSGEPNLLDECYDNFFSMSKKSETCSNFGFWKYNLFISIFNSTKCTKAMQHFFLSSKNIE